MKVLSVLSLLLCLLAAARAEDCKQTLSNENLDAFSHVTYTEGTDNTGAFFRQLSLFRNDKQRECEMLYTSYFGGSESDDYNWDAKRYTRNHANGGLEIIRMTNLQAGAATAGDGSYYVLDNTNKENRCDIDKITFLSEQCGRLHDLYWNGLKTEVQP